MLRIGGSAQDEDVSDLLSLLKELSLEEQEKLFIDSDIASITTNDF